MKLFILMFSVVVSFSALANTPEEVEYLLDFVENTDCIYERNGKQYNGPEARDHIQKKYEYYKDEIKSGEDFIQYSATKSLMSGVRYKVDCPGEKQQFSADWLLIELQKYRTGQ